MTVQAQGMNAERNALDDAWAQLDIWRVRKRGLKDEIAAVTREIVTRRLAVTQEQLHRTCARSHRKRRPRRRARGADIEDDSDAERTEEAIRREEGRSSTYGPKVGSRNNTGHVHTLVVRDVEG